MSGAGRSRSCARWVGERKGAVTHTFLQVLVSGILVGGLYGMFSSGLALVLGSTKVVNFAHGDFVTLGMYGAVQFVRFGLNPLESLVPIALIMFVVGGAVYRVTLSRSVLEQQQSPGDKTGFSHVQLVITISLSLVIENGLQVVYGPNSQSINGFLSSTLVIGGIYIPDTQAVAFGIACVTFAVLYFVIHRTRQGKALQAIVDNLGAAALVGINAGRMYIASFATGCALAAISGVVLVTYYPAVPTTGLNLLTIAFVVIILGGLGNTMGAFFSGIAIGVVQQLTATYVNIGLENIGLFLVFIVAMLFFPRGIFARQGAAL